MSDPAYCQVIGRWRITGSDMWARDFLDLANPAYFTLDNAGHGESSARRTSNLTVEYGRKIVFFRFAGLAEGDELWGDGPAEIAGDGTLEIERHSVEGDEPTFTAQREWRGPRSSRFRPAGVSPCKPTQKNPAVLTAGF